MKPMVKLISTKPQFYRTRMLQANEAFEAHPLLAMLLVKSKKAVAASTREPVTIAKPPAALAYKVAALAHKVAAPAHKPADDPDLAAARKAYAAKFGRNPFYGWTAAQVQAKIDEA